jgi:hypothetical protein
MRLPCHIDIYIGVTYIFYFITLEGTLVVGLCMIAQILIKVVVMGCIYFISLLMVEKGGGILEAENILKRFL